MYKRDKKRVREIEKAGENSGCAKGIIILTSLGSYGFDRLAFARFVVTVVTGVDVKLLFELVSCPSLLFEPPSLS